MRRRSAYALVTLSAAACSSAGGVPSVPLVWSPGAYYVEATISYNGGAGTQQDLYSADLYIEADQSLRLDSHQGVCVDPTPPELQRDSERRVRTFRCGAVVFELRPGMATVGGSVVATVQEGYTITECIRYAVNGTCAQTSTRVATRPASKEARLRVRARG